MLVHLIDGTYELFRTYFGAPSAESSDGREIGATRALLRSFATFLRQEVEKAVLFFEPRIELDTVRFERLADREGLVEMRLDYTVRATNTRNNLVFPFYLDEATNV